MAADESGDRRIDLGGDCGLVADPACIIIASLYALGLTMLGLNYGLLIGALGRGKLVCHCLLIETDDGLVWVDTGLGTRDVAQPVRRLGATFVAMTAPVLSQQETALAHVARLGFKRADVRHLIATHLDLDHAGGFADFPEASVHVFGPEQRAALTPATYRERQRYRAVQWEHRPKWEPRELGGEHWLGFESVRALAGSKDDDPAGAADRTHARPLRRRRERRTRLAAPRGRCLLRAR